MIREITTYPTPPSVEYGTDVRVFNDEIASIIQDLKDTIIENSLEALSAYQIGEMYNIIVVKKVDDSFLELINPRIISSSEKITTLESTAYFPGLSANVERHNNISIIYEDREFNQCNLKANGSEAILLQRKIDYTFGYNDSGNGHFTWDISIYISRSNISNYVVISTICIFWCTWFIRCLFFLCLV